LTVTEPAARSDQHGTGGATPRRWAIAAVLPCLLVAFAAPSVLPRYGRMDDYNQLDMVLRGGRGSLIELGASFGRPITFLFNAQLYDWVGSVDGLWIMRAVGVLLWAAAIATLVLAGHRAGVPAPWAVALGSVAGALPGTWVMITWAQGAGHALSFYLAALSVWAFTEKRVPTPVGVLLALPLLFASMFGYQLYALTVPAIVAAIAVASGQYRPMLHPRLLSLGTSVIAFLINVGLVRSSAPPGLEQRTNLATDWAGKAAWVVDEFLPRVLWPFSLEARGVLACMSALAAVALWGGAAYRMTRTRGVLSAVSEAGFLVLVLLLPAATQMVISENWASSRAVLAPALAFWLLLIASLSRLSFLAEPAGGPPNRTGRTVALLITLGLVVCSAAMASLAYRLMALASSREWTQAITIWSAVDRSPARAEVLQQPFVSDAVGPASYDEFGILTGSVAWAIPAMHSLAAKRSGLSITPDQVRPIDAGASCDSAPLIDDESHPDLIVINPTRAWGCSVSP
jgi:hypothetical protein